MPEFTGPKGEKAYVDEDHFLNNAGPRGVEAYWRQQQAIVDSIVEDFKNRSKPKEQLPKEQAPKGYKPSYKPRPPGNLGGGSNSQGSGQTDGGGSSMPRMTQPTKIEPIQQQQGGGGGIFGALLGLGLTALGVPPQISGPLAGIITGGGFEDGLSQIAQSFGTSQGGDPSADPSQQGGEQVSSDKFNKEGQQANPSFAPQAPQPQDPAQTSQSPAPPPPEVQRADPNLGSALGMQLPPQEAADSVDFLSAMNGGAPPASLQHMSPPTPFSAAMNYMSPGGFQRFQQQQAMQQTPPQTSGFGDPNQQMSPTAWQMTQPGLPPQLLAMMTGPTFQGNPMQGMNGFGGPYPNPFA